MNLNSGLGLVKCSNSSSKFGLVKCSNSSSNSSSDDHVSESKEIENQIKTTLYPPGWHTEHITTARCEPLIEILSATLSSKTLVSDLTKPTNIIGQITVEDLDTNNVCLIYDRSVSDEYGPEGFYYFNRVMTLNVKRNLFAMQKPTLKVDLRNLSNGGCRLAYGEHRLIRSVDDDGNEEEGINDKFEQVRDIVFKGDGEVESLHIRYLSMTYGVKAYVTVNLHREGHDQQMKEPHNNHEKQTSGDDGIEVYGNITASYNLLKHPQTDVSIPLLTAIESEPEKMEVGAQILMSRYSVAIPAYSSLRVLVDLKDYHQASHSSQPLSHGIVTHDTANSLSLDQIIPGKDGLYVRVNVVFSKVYNLDEDDQMEYQPTMCSVPHNSLSLKARQTLQVFSVVVGRPHNTKLNMYGYIAASDYLGWCNIFKRDKNDPHTLSPGTSGSLLPLKGPWRVNKFSDYFVIAVDLNDMDEQVNIKGFATASHEIEDRVEQWYDRWHCLVVKDRKGSSSPKRPSLDSIFSENGMDYAAKHAAEMDVQMLSTTDDCMSP